ncbi:hypothetical protein BGZ47_006257 [Haplosporangium gracile]|nr:hypothetical protein BGZ47_006257 [Haplosporangium gracile]
MTESSNLEHQSPHGELRTAFYNPYDIKRRRRTSRSQFKTLEKAFIENPKPNASTRQQLAQRLSMTPRGIQVWFQNRRAKKKQANTAVHQANPNPSTDEQQIEDDLGPEGDSLLVSDKSGPTEGYSPSYAPPSLTVESSKALSEPPTTKKAQATRSDSVMSDFSSSSVLSIEALAVETDIIQSQGLSDDNRSMLDPETWGRSQTWSSAGTRNPSTNLQSRPAPFVDLSSSSSLSGLGPAAPQLIDRPRLVKKAKLKDNSLPRITTNRSDNTECPPATFHSESFAKNVYAGPHPSKQRPRGEHLERPAPEPIYGRPSAIVTPSTATSILSQQRQHQFHHQQQ